jgi:GNAT superfamily N-acetyltransferase
MLPIDSTDFYPPAGGIVVARDMSPIGGMGESVASIPNFNATGAQIVGPNLNCSFPNEKSMTSTLRVAKQAANDRGPYPPHVKGTWRAPDGSIMRVRPIEVADAMLIREFVHALSFETRYLRFMYGVRELSAQTIDRLTRVDHRRDAALVAILNAHGEDRVVGVARYAVNDDGESGDFAIVVADDWQRRGLGSRLLTLLLDIASARGLKRIRGDVLAINRSMVAFVKAHGFTTSWSHDGPTSLRVERSLDHERVTNRSMA